MKNDSFSLNRPKDKQQNSGKPSTNSNKKNKSNNYTTMDDEPMIGGNRFGNSGSSNNSNKSLVGTKNDPIIGSKISDNKKFDYYKSPKQSEFTLQRPSGSSNNPSNKPSTPTKSSNSGKPNKLSAYLQKEYGKGGDVKSRKSIDDVSRALKKLGIKEEDYSGSAKHNRAILKELKRDKWERGSGTRELAKKTVDNLPKASYDRNDSSDNKTKPADVKGAWDIYTNMKRKSTKSPVGPEITKAEYPKAKTTLNRDKPKTQTAVPAANVSDFKIEKNSIMPPGSRPRDLMKKKIQNELAKNENISKLFA